MVDMIPHYSAAEGCNVESIGPETAEGLWLQQLDQWIEDPTLEAEVPKRILDAFLSVRAFARGHGGRMTIDFVKRPSQQSDGA